MSNYGYKPDYSKLDQGWNDKEYNEIKNRIPAALDDFCQVYGVEDLTTESQNKFCAALIYTADVLGVRKELENIEDPQHSIDIKKCYQLLEILIILSNLYNKEISPYTFSCISGIGFMTVLEWNNSNDFIYIDNNNYNNSSDSNNNINKDAYRNRSDELNRRRKLFYKNLVKLQEQSLSNLLVSSKGNSVGLIAALNYRAGWNQGQEKDETETRRQLISRNDIKGALPGV